MRAILVSVDFADLLAVTLPYNRHHFDEVMVVTTPGDEETRKVTAECDAAVFVTGAFYEEGADFAKWKALEMGLDALGRRGWLCVMDADVLWPKVIDMKALERGHLYTPRRRMLQRPELLVRGGKFQVPQEMNWDLYPLHPQQQEWAGYTQMFHAEDPHLPRPPWHQTDWRHAGGADSFFQALWPVERKLRPPFEVLHLGESGRNWCGRVTRRLDSSEPSLAMERYAKLKGYIRGRVQGPDRFRGERLH